MASENITIRVDRIVTTLDRSLVFRKGDNKAILDWSYKMLPKKILGFKKVRNFRKPKELFVSFVKYKDKKGRKLLLISEPRLIYMPRLCLIFIPTVKSQFNFKLIKKICGCLSFKPSHFKLSTLEIAIDNEGQREYANNFWNRSQRFGYSKAKKNWEVDFLKIVDDCVNYQKIKGSRQYKQISSYEKEECGLTFERNELVMKRSFLRSIGVRSLQDLNDKGAMKKICTSFYMLRFKKKEFEFVFGKIDWMKKGSNNYDLKYIVSELNAEHGQLTKENEERVSWMPFNWVRVFEIAKLKRIPNFRRKYMSELRINGTIRMGIKKLIRDFFKD